MIKKAFKLRLETLETLSECLSIFYSCFRIMDKGKMTH